MSGGLSPRYEISFRPALVRTILLAVALVMTMTIMAKAASPSATKKDDGFQTTVPSAILIEAESGALLFEKNADQLIFPASLAKLMTAEIVFNEIGQGRLKLDDAFTVSADAWKRGGARSGGSTMFAAINSRISVENLLRGVIIQSANDACIVLAEGIAGSEAAFAEMMNRRARELGLEKSNFTNSTGLPDPEMKVTARELARLSRHLIATYPEFYKWYGEREFTWSKIRQQNRNPLLAMNIGADGLKTGFTKEAGYNLVGSAVQNDMRLIAVVAGAKTANERADEARRLIHWGFAGFERRLLFVQDQPVGEAQVYGGESRSVALRAATGKPVFVMVPKQTTERIVAKIVYRGPVRAPIVQGQDIGLLKISRGSNLVLEVSLVAVEDVGVGSLTRRAFDAGAEFFGGMLRAGFKKL